MNLKEKLEAATKNYEACRTRLDKVRADYEGPQKEYAETKVNLVALTSQIKENEALLAESKPKLSKELRRSNGERTDAVKNLLSERRNTEELVEELRVIVKEVENRIGNLRITISPLASTYQSAYASAAENWARVKGYRALIDCAPRLCEALSSVPHSVNGAPYGGLNPGEKTFSSRKFILEEIEALFQTYEYGAAQYSTELGKFDLGAFTMSEMLTPAGKKNLLREIDPYDPI